MSRGPSQATLLVELVCGSGVELFHSRADEAWVLLPCESHRECWPVRSRIFRQWIARLFFEEHGTAPGAQALSDALTVIEGYALYSSFEHAVELRLAARDGAIWLDLADDHWQAVRISADGWEVVHDPPIRFRRPRGMLPLPVPVTGGSIDELREFVNIDDLDWPLLLGWIVGALRPHGPYPILLVHGEQGSAKSTLLRVVRALVDPNEAPVRSAPKDGKDLIVAARNGLIVAFDNVSKLAPELSDDLARLATGSGFGARQLYTDLDEVLVNVARPIAVNGIAELATRGDLLDRGIVLNLPRISRYQDEDSFWATFAVVHPKILGALLDAVSAAMGTERTIGTPNVRMADFARWATAAEPGLGLAPGTFIDAYGTNRAAAVQVVLEESLIAGPVRTIAETGGYEGTPTELLQRIAAIVGETATKQRGWPSRPHVLSGELRRIAPALRRQGIDVQSSRTNTRRTIRITVLEPRQEAASPASPGVSTTAARDASDARDARSPRPSGGTYNGGVVIEQGPPS